MKNSNLASLIFLQDSLAGIFLTGRVGITPFPCQPIILTHHSEAERRKVQHSENKSILREFSQSFEAVHFFWESATRRWVFVAQRLDAVRWPHLQGSKGLLACGRCTHFHSFLVDVKEGKLQSCLSGPSMPSLS